MIFMGMSQNNGFQLVFPGFNEPQVRQNHIYAGHAFIRKADAQINHQPSFLIVI